MTQRTEFIIFWGLVGLAAALLVVGACFPER